MSYIQKSPWVIHFDGFGCAGCSMEVQSCFAPQHDMEKFGIKMTNNPKHADVLLVTGVIDDDNGKALNEIYEQMLEPKAVVAAGACACSGGIFEGLSNICAADNIIPVDIYIPGCAAVPEAICEGIVKSFENIESVDNQYDEDKALQDESIDADKTNSGAENGKSPCGDEGKEEE